MKKILFIITFLIAYSGARSMELTISCSWNEKIYFNENKIMIKKEKVSEKEFFYINSNFKFFGKSKNYGTLSDPDNEFNKHDVFEFKNNIFFKLSDLSDGKLTHYFTTKYDRGSGKIIDEFININPNFGKVQSTRKYGNCEEIVFQTCENEKVLICSGNYYNFNKITKEKIKYDKEKKYFFCKKKKIISEKPFLEYQKTFPDHLDKNKYEVTQSDYIVKLYNSEGYNYSYIKLDINNLEIKESLDLPRINITFSGKCISTNNM